MKILKISCIVFILALTASLSHGQNISFNQASLNFNDYAPINSGTSLKFGPDERLYVSQLNGEIKIYTIFRDSPNEYSVIGEETLGSIKSIPNYDDNGLLAFDSRGNRQITGLTVVGTSANPVIYVTSSDPKWGGPSGDKGLDTNSGIISQISWTGEAWETIDLVRGLPRSEENHSINGIEFTMIQGKPFLLVAIGGFTNAGSPSKNFAYITEYALSAAIISVDLEAIGNLETKIDPISGRMVKYDIPTLDDPSRPNVNGIYDPNDPGYDGIDVNDPFGGNDGLNMGMVVEGGPVQIYSGGYRNSYDLVVTEGGKVFATDNGANINWGGLPENEGNPLLVNNNYLVSEQGGSPLNPTTSGEYVDNRDHLLMITSNVDEYLPGGFYGGHPTPIRANPGNGYVLGEAFPFDPQGAGLYTHFSTDALIPIFTPIDTFRTKILEPIAPGQPGFSLYAATSLPANWPPVPLAMARPEESDFIAPSLPNTNGPQPTVVTPFPNNSNGIDEYKASNFGGAIKGSLIVGKNEGQLHLINLNEDGSLKSAEFNKFNLNGGNALGIACNGDGEIFPGTIWVTTFDNRIMVLTPTDDVICISTDDPEFDPLADYDFDGYSNQDELDNGTDYCSGASIPNDYDRDFVSDLNDLDDDGDGTLDQDDPFQLGDPRNLPINNELFTNQRDNRGRANGYLGLGLTGFMNNGAPNPNWLNWLDKGEETPGPPDIYGGTAGAIQVSMTGGTANGTTNTQEKGFQFGVNVSTETGPFTISSGLIGLASPGQLYDFDGNGEVGIQMGDGSQSNFIKFVFTKDGLTVSQELNDIPQIEPLFYDISLEDRPGSNTLIELSFDVDPENGTVKPHVKFGENPRILIGELNAQGAILQAIQSLENPLAIGIYGTSNDWDKSFIGVWNFFRVMGEQPFIIRSINDYNRLFNDPDLILDLTEYFDDNGGDENLVFSVHENTNGMFEVSINGKILQIGLPNDAVSTDVTIRATDALGFYSDQKFRINVEQDKKIIRRINAGGNLIPDTTGGPDWLANSVVGAFESEFYSVSAGANSGHTFDPANRHPSIPDYISDDLYTAIFARERYNSGGGGQMVFEIPLPDGDYMVNIYMGNGFGGTSNVTNRVFNIMIEDEVVESNLDLVARYGHQVGGMEQYPVRITDGFLNITYINNIQSALVNAIEIWGKPIQTPILVEKLEDQLSFIGQELDGSLFVGASGGDGALNYQATGLPPGLDIEPTNGTIYGVIEDGAIGNSPYRVTITVDDSDEISSDAVSFNLSWTISPPISELKWTLKNESNDYAARHENAFVQAGNRFYLMGGRESARTIDVYNYESDSWESLSNVSPFPFNHFQAVEYKGLIWVIGGFQSNNFPDEIPTENIWAFNPVNKKWIRGPQIPDGRRRGSSGLVTYNDKFYIVNGNTLGHAGGAVKFFDEYDPSTGKWTVLPDSPRPRDHFYSTVIGSKMYVAGGRLSGGEGGVFGPLIQQVDVYNFSDKTWSTLDASKNIPTPRAGAITNNYFNKLIIAGGETPTPGPALATTEIFDPITQEWEQIADMNFPRHGTQGIVSGKGLYTTAGSPNRGGGKQHNMEYFGFDNPGGTALKSSELLNEDTLYLKAGEIVRTDLEVTSGNQGIYIYSVKVKNDPSNNFSIRNKHLEHIVLKPDSKLKLEMEYVGSQLVDEAVLEIIKSDSSKIEIKLIADGNYEEVNIFLNTGSTNDEMYLDNLYLSDTKFNSYFNSNTSSGTNTAASDIPIFQSHRFAAALNYRIPVPNGVYTVKTFHHETYFGLHGPSAQPGRRVFDISLEGQLVKDDLDLFVETENQPLTLVFENVEVLDGVLNLDFVASKNNATLAAISIQNQGRIGEVLIPKIIVSKVSGIAPLTIQFQGQESTGQGILTYLWNFGDGNFSMEVNPIHTFENPGIYEVSLTVQDTEDNVSTESIEIKVLNPFTEFTLNLNTGTVSNVVYEGKDFNGDTPFVDYYSQSFTRTNTAISTIPLYQSHRFETTLKYTIPVPNGNYIVKTYHNEFYFGKMVSTTGPGRRVFDIFLEGQLVKDNFDIFLESNNEPTELSFFNVEVTDGVLNLDMVASANSASISGISIELLQNEVIRPEAVISALITDGVAPLSVSFDGSASTGEGVLTYLWVFDENSQSTEMSPTHVFTRPGIYEVSLTVTGENGLSDTKSFSIEVKSSATSFKLFINTGTQQEVSFENNSYVGDGLTPEIYSTSNSRTVQSISPEPLFQSHRFATILNYSIPVPNGNYIVETHHNEFYFGKMVSTTGPGRRVFDIFLEGELVKDNYDIFIESNNEPHSLTFYNIAVTDGVLNLNMVASANSASISGISIVSIDGNITHPVAIATASVVEGEVPLNVQFDGSLSIGDGELLYEWNFGNGAFSNEVSPLYTFTEVGEFNATLTITDQNRNENSDNVLIKVNDTAPLFELYLNSGTSANVSYKDSLFLGDSNYGNLFSASTARTNVGASTIPLFQSHRFASQLYYTIPVPNGVYRVKTYHNELYFGKVISSTGPGRRVFDIHIEGIKVRSNLDFFVENQNEPFELEFKEIVVEDGFLNLDLLASQNNASISGVMLIQTSKSKPGGGEMLRTLDTNEEEQTISVYTEIEPLVYGLYPNPATFETSLVVDEKVKVTQLYVHDMAGRLISNFQNHEQISRFVIPVHDYKPGVYIVSLISDENVIKQLRLIVKK